MRDRYVEHRAGTGETIGGEEPLHGGFLELREVLARTLESVRAARLHLENIRGQEKHASHFLDALAKRRLGLERAIDRCSHDVPAGVLESHVERVAEPLAAEVQPPLATAALDEVVRWDARLDRRLADTYRELEKQTHRPALRGFCENVIYLLERHARRVISELHRLRPDCRRNWV